MAVATGAMQVAAIKKQQQASQAQGYGEGGFTRRGVPTRWLAWSMPGNGWRVRNWSLHPLPVL